MPSNCLHSMNSAKSSTKSMVVAMLQMLWKFLTSELSALGLFLQLLWLASYQDLDQLCLKILLKRMWEEDSQQLFFFFNLFLSSRFTVLLQMHFHCQTTFRIRFFWLRYIVLLCCFRLCQQLTTSQSSLTPVSWFKSSSAHAQKFISKHFLCNRESTIWTLGISKYLYSDFTI